MRKASDNNLKLWRAVDERHTVQACVVHDLHNPLAIVEDTVEYLRVLASTGELTGEKLEALLENLAVTTKRMENYTNYIRDLDALENVFSNAVRYAERRVELAFTLQRKPLIAESPTTGRASPKKC